MNGSEDSGDLQCTVCKGWTSNTYRDGWKLIGPCWYCARCHVEITGNAAWERLKVAVEALKRISGDRGSIVIETPKAIAREALAKIDVTVTGVNQARLAFIKTHRPEITHNEGTGQWFVTWTDEKGQSNEEFGLTFEEVLDNARVPEEQVREVDA